MWQWCERTQTEEQVSPQNEAALGVGPGSWACGPPRGEKRTEGGRRQAATKQSGLTELGHSRGIPERALRAAIVRYDSYDVATCPTGGGDWRTGPFRRQLGAESETAIKAANLVAAENHVEG